MDRIKAHFSESVDDYDTVADHVVFNNNEAHHELINNISFNKDKPIKILDLGCGTGHGLRLAVETFPNSVITGIDFSGKMIRKSSDKLASFSNLTLKEIDFRDYAFDEKYDVIISAFAIHNITHEEKKVLFQKIFSSLNEKGLFINADFYEHDSQTINDQIKEVYRGYLNQNLEGNELKVWLKHAFEEDIPMSLTQQASILKELGFSQFKITWLFNNQAVYVAYK